VAERILFLTGHLAEPRLTKMLAAMGETGFEWEVVDIGVQVAALMTEPIILRRLPRPVAATRVVLPGRAGVDPTRLSEAFGVTFELVRTSLLICRLISAMADIRPTSRVTTCASLPKLSMPRHCRWMICCAVPAPWAPRAPT
jgi:hypothetical protein